MSQQPGHIYHGHQLTAVLFDMAFVLFDMALFDMAFVTFVINA